jgi:two-component system sensor histidine kinase KdpD
MAYRNIFGVIALNSSWISINQDPAMKRYLEAIASLTAIAIHRLQLTEKANENKVMAESQRLQKALFDSMSHDLNTPLTSILGAVGNLLEEEDLFSKEDKTELLQSIQQGAFDMNRLVRNLLDMAQLDSRVLTLHKEYADIADIVEESLRKLKQSSKWQIKKMIDISLPSIKIDSTLIEQVVINLLDNAFKYSQEGSTITIRSYGESSRLYFMIEDEGVGIPSDELDAIFSKFYRSTNIKTIRGSGLGLSICKGIVEAHGGKIWASHKQGGGSRITFFLPYDWRN